MIHVLQDLPDNAIGIEAEGKVTKEDYEGTIKPLIDEKQRAHDKVRLLYVLGDEFEGYTPGAIWEDSTLAFKRPGSWERIAVVSDHEWIRKVAVVVLLDGAGRAEGLPHGRTGRSEEVAIGGMSRAARAK